ncbi:uncharacterized protein LY89DRAFT_745890 [Mollisia scopiformis]|uniref:Uncharacterized protein n=1 Tax=Mollisia scopiformis TaxID=149040 RepID=A0A194XCK3_MOLSC|nr:uncharacterized protein LY89DRAFT_745890 [Mollisia scopiformis]KUJ17900.1 hypothetical protein LY89DRAFT_745890 [Mollisia scopiformis]
MAVELKDEDDVPLAFIFETNEPIFGPNHYIQAITRGEDLKTFRHMFRPPCECEECNQQYKTAINRDTRLPDGQFKQIKRYSSYVADEEAKTQASRAFKKISADRAYLKEQCYMNGNTILKRWKKLTPSERARHLLLVDNDLYQHQWADVIFSRKFAERLKVFRKAVAEGSVHWHGCIDLTQGRERRPYRNTFLLPYINVEALASDPLRLLNLLHNRTKYSPAEWAPYDTTILAKDWELGTFETAYSSVCIIMHGSEYGKVTRWEESAAHRWDIVGFPRAILTLEAQQKLLAFLRGIVEKLLEGFSRNDTSPQSDRFEKIIGLRSASPGGSSPDEFASTYLNQPFSAPPKFDIEELLSIAQTQLNMHGDNLWLLQTDPRYFRRYAKLLVDGGLATNLTKTNQYVCTHLELMQRAIQFWSWEGILEATLKLQATYRSFDVEVKVGEALSSQYNHALGSLEALLYDQLQRRIQAIRYTLLHRPGFQSKWNVKYVQRLQSMSVSIGRKVPGETPADVLYNDRLNFCTFALTDKEDIIIDNHEHTDPRRKDFSMLFAMFDEHLADCHKKKDKLELARLDEILYELFADMSSVHQMLSLVRWHRPHPPTPSIQDLKSSEDGKVWRYIEKQFFEQSTWRQIEWKDGKWVDHLRPELKECGSKKIAAEQRLATLLKNFMETPKPTGTRFSQTWLDQDASERAALSKFWEGMRARHEGTLRRLGFDASDIHSDLKVLSADRDAEYLAEIEAEKQAILTGIAARETEKEAKKLLKAQGKKVLQTQWGLEQPDPLVTPLSKLKIKRHGVAEQSADQHTTDEAPTAVQLESDATSATEEKICVGVSKRSLLIFRGMFPSNNPEERSRSVDWDAFVNAMGEEPISFVARHSAGGSAYSFEPSVKSKWFGKGKIVFHKPHPVPILDPIELSTNGKRMAKWFGWSEETFQLREK